MEARVKAGQLFLMAYYNFLSGAIFSVIGTSLPDLRCLFHVQLDEVASLFLALGLTAGISGLLAVFLIKKINTYILMTILMIMYTVGTAIVALTHSIYVAWIGLLVAGFSDGAVISCCLVLCNLLFKTESYTFHVLSTSVSAGAFLGPIISKPFLGKEIPDFGNSSLSQASLTNNSNNSAFDNLYCAMNSSQINVLYLVMASLGLPLAFGLCISYHTIKPEVIKDGSTSKETRNTDHGVYKIAFTFLIALLLPMAYGLSFAYGSYLTTMGVDGQLQIGIEASATLTSIFWLMFGVGRLTSTAVSIFIRQQVVLFVCLLGQIVSAGFLSWTYMYTWSEEALWVGTLSLAFFSGPGYAGLITWSRDYITLTPTILCIYNLMDSVGASLLPFLCGILINACGEGAHLFFILALCLLEMLFYLIAYYLGRKIKSEEGKTVDGCVLTNISVITS